MKTVRQKETHGFTLRANGIAKMLAMEIEIFAVGSSINPFRTKGIWDTGATNSVITKEVVEHLKILPSGMTTVNTASETGIRTNTYTVDIALKSDVRLTGAEVTVGTIIAENGFNCLIGMDIISLGDFSITNLNGITCLSFRIPSQHEIDFVKEIAKNEVIIKRHFDSRKKMDDKCICGSGRRFKNCHGINMEEI